MFSKNVFGERLREIRKKNHDTQPIISKLIDVAVSQVSDMENGKKTTTVEKFSILCEHYNVSADYLLGLTDEPEPYQRKKAE